MTSSGTEQTPRVAVLGGGYWGRNLVRNFQAIGALATVCDASAEGRDLAKKLAPGAKVVADVPDVWNDSAITGVVVATPAETHARLGQQAPYIYSNCLNLGKIRRSPKPGPGPSHACPLHEGRASLERAPAGGGRHPARRRNPGRAKGPLPRAGQAAPPAPGGQGRGPCASVLQPRDLARLHLHAGRLDTPAFARLIGLA